MNRVVALVRCCHPEPTAAVTGLTTALAVSVGRGWGSVWVTAAVLSGQLSVGWANDYIDRDRDRAAGRTSKPIAGVRIGATTVRNAAIVALVLAVPLSLLSGPAAAAVHLTAIALAHAYNLWLKATVLSVVPYALAFAMLPVFVTLGLGANAHVPAAWI
nr:UbiA family prenyltransferase [Candidatus Dormibacteraeota bacterium]